MGRPEILNQYAAFISKVEQGKFRWGSKKDLHAFDLQLLYCVALDHKREESKGDKLQRFCSKLDKQNKYCLDYNHGTCNLEGPYMKKRLMA